MSAEHERWQEDWRWSSDKDGRMQLYVVATDRVFHLGQMDNAGPMIALTWQLNKYVAELGALRTQLAEALSQRQLAVEEAERLRGELAAANQDAEALAANVEAQCSWHDDPWVVGLEGSFHLTTDGAYIPCEYTKEQRDLLAAHAARLASQPPAEAEGA